MHKHAILLMCLFGNIVTVQAQTISHYEYWLDGDYQSKVMTSSTDTNVNVSLPLDGLASGLHFFNFRATNSVGEISNVFRTMFYLQDTPTATTLKRSEYWVDDDYSHRVSRDLKDGSVNVSLPLDGLASGLHFFNFRATNDVGEISNVFRTMFYLQDTPTAAILKRSEYWIDDDYSHRVSGDLKDASISSVVDLRQQPAGLHFFNLRTFNSNDEVSNIYRTLFYLPDKDIVDVAGYEYWIDNDSLNRVSCTNSQSVLLLEVDVSSLDEGIHTLNFRAKNSFDEWGDVYSEEFEVMIATSARQIEKGNDTFDVYNLRGEKVMDNANWSDLSRLSRSIYIINGRKIVIK